MGASPAVAAGTHEKPREFGASVLMEEDEPTYLSATTLDFDREPPVEPEVPDADVILVDSLVTARHPCPAPVAGPSAAQSLAAVVVVLCGVSRRRCGPVHTDPVVNCRGKEPTVGHKLRM